MKKSFIILFSLFLVFSNLVSAQTGLRFGLKSGFNIATQYGISSPDIPYEVNSNSRNGFVGGILLYFPITDSFGVQQEFLYTTKGSRQQITMTQPMLSTSTKYNINYFELPMLFRYTFVNIGNVSVFGSSGFALSMLLNGKYNIDGELDLGGSKLPFSELGNTDGLDQFDYSFIYGLGLNFNILNKNWFLDYRQTIGWNTLMMPTSQGGEPAPLRNQTYTFSLGMYL